MRFAAAFVRGGKPELAAQRGQVARLLHPGVASHDGMCAIGGPVTDPQFRAVDAMLTNFHLPQSSLLMLVCAFAGREFTLAAYQHSIEERYRFFSYGDCMLIL